MAESSSLPLAIQVGRAFLPQLMDTKKMLAKWAVDYAVLDGKLDDKSGLFEVSYDLDASPELDSTADSSVHRHGLRCKCECDLMKLQEELILGLLSVNWIIAESRFHLGSPQF
ncbi:hypothetical protein BJ508DRAFT_165719 [Ascobolus immersus RN42]|uniref:Uncharacterized protein n=1 Tax=Ascobolus immersus RN42 TaxID=1160509 RepID=A0A3N4HV10_ASCIM|nr:hypothetical protein BJ508DRAFT_165719 [Ascobolus immersus RN42]